MDKKKFCVNIDHALDKTREQVEREGYLLLDKDLKELEKKRDILYNFV